MIKKKYMKIIVLFMALIMVISSLAAGLSFY